MPQKHTSLGKDGGNAAGAGGRSRPKISARQALSLIGEYASSKIGAQVKAISFVVIYLFVAQTLVLKAPVQDALGVALGVAATVVGLAFFLEGLFLGIMPLGEQCGLRLPSKGGILGVAIFSIVIGVTATLAEPAIGFLKIQGSAVAPWDAPLLFYLLNRGSLQLVFAIACGVGLAVLVGVFRFIYGWPFKPAVFLIMPVLLAVGLYFEGDPSLRPVANLAWDTGGVTTGPVTVPLVIALGMGVSKIAGARKGAAPGLGVVTLASALPVAAVFLLAVLVNPNVPAPTSPEAFFAPENRAKAAYAAGDEETLGVLAAEAVKAGKLSAARYGECFPDRPLNKAASPAEAQGAGAGEGAGEGALATAWTKLKDALSTVLPLALVLILTILIVIRERIRDLDTVALGLCFTVIGMFLFGIGMASGISALGSQAGAALPRAYTQTEEPPLVVTGADESSVFTAPGAGGSRPYIWIDGIAGEDGPKAVPFYPERLDREKGAYTYIPVENALFARWGAWGTRLGLLAVLVFVYILGFGATLAEPSLAALGVTVEELTTGTYKKSTLISMVAIGVGFGMAAGFARILFNLPLAWILILSYIPALVLTAFADEGFAAIAWDCAGVTTGPVTVPLVIAAGLGIGKEAGAAGGAFGVVATASVFPILAVLVSGNLYLLKAKNFILKAKNFIPLIKDAGETV